MAKKKIGLLVMAYGTPRSLDDVEAYYTHIRHGRPPEQEALDDLIDRYKAIGGISPLARITDEQMHALETRLNEQSVDKEFKAYLGLKHIDPFIEDAVAQMKEDGIEEAVSIVLAPHYSTFSVKSYNGRALEKAKEIDGPTIYTVENWYKEPKFLQFWKEQLEDVYQRVSREHSVVIFSAHSLPEKILTDNDPYVDQLKETARLIAEAAKVQNYEIGWQSEGNTADKWLGPDVQDLTRTLYEKNGYETFIYCPVGFVADHLEVLYDNDIECKIVTDDLGVNYERPDMPNAHPLFIQSLADAITKRLKIDRA
ncbi:ferrochelatase [Natribacillus halophilus]|uniref:Coproporphyrin III ferrochelatase n=1 Tax=Natribacillus halophilus TaxID=549003 RepID=A0A1G8NZE5_9BACI|nr:ferrochelatase [Natribacillus halophilus]SDI84890.1 ferrochelatase [Natribacillus halophilus]